ncbi:MAG: GTP cyclohydrolase FolE2 [Phycisphaerales bacterium]|nr:GTP cyclohydrolase FolE2 [Phycisphaerales bacterium]
MTSAPNSQTHETMPDIQSEPDRRRVAIDKVGVKEIKHPITLSTMDGRSVETVAGINMYVSLPADRKGTHMSRFLETINEYRENLQPDRIIQLSHELCDNLDAADAHVEMNFPYFIMKKAPVTGLPGLMDYQCEFRCEANKNGQDFVMSVGAAATSLCPCSKEISAYGAHNQRCLITAEIRFNSMIWIEELVEHIESAASCPVYSVLKRPDEKLVTEQAFENPKFVEDIVRDLAIRLDDDERICWYHVKSENFESIHNHNAYAEITRDKRS